MATTNCEIHEVKAPALDPITYVLQDFGPGQGKLIIECYGQAWSAFWGAMGKRSLRDFLKDCDVPYITNCLLRGAYLKQNKLHAAYLQRIVLVVQAAITG